MDRLSTWIFGRKSHRILLLGDDSSGKTTFLRQLKFGEVGETEPQPTRALDVETVYFPANYEWNIWEFRIRCKPVIWRALAPHILVVWLHDCTTDDWPPCGFLGLLKQMVDSGCRYIWVGLNKQDSPHASVERVEEARRKYAEELAKYKDQISSKVVTLSAKTGEGVPEVLADIHQTVVKVKLPPPGVGDEEGKMEKAVRGDTTVERLTTEDLPHLVEEEIFRDALDADAFWAPFLKGDLPRWTHYIYLKALYFIILAQAKRKDFYQIAEEFTVHLNRLRNTAPFLFEGSKTPKVYENAPFSRCLATFWTLQLQHAIREHRRHTMSAQLPSRNDFPNVLRHSPSLIDSYLWIDYYSTEPPWRPRDIWSAPTRRALPTQTNYLRDPATLSVRDEGPDRLVRYAFAVMQYVRSTGAPRGKVVTQALRALQQSTMRGRAADPTVEAYSETQAYFWIQMVHAALRSLDDEKGVRDTSEMSFEAFQEVFHLKPTEWKGYYSKKVWNGVSARSEFKMPDLKALPNVITSVADAKPLRATDISPGTSKLPSIEELTFRARMLCDELTEDLQSRGPPLLTHAHLLFYLHKRFTQSTEEAKEERLQRQANELFSEITGPMVAGPTQRNFWIQQVGFAVLDPDTRGESSTFPEFITSNLHLVYEELHGIYYSPRVWDGMGARERIQGPDRREMEAIAELEDEDWEHV
ncbi:uncharacterized protein BJX67DRAFT_76762 [Aspergillus lucknowensis]|uniref:Uncharacterized protein n=1 Tax=Aspergillus lucknowensis TaxID=176173 RepID=A0ABR4LT52_9EURO